MVIGNEDLCGDPIFTDNEDENFPIFTAMHSMGSWQENLIADNFESFVKSLEIAAKCMMKESCLEQIELLNNKSDLEFWKLLFED